MKHVYHPVTGVLREVRECPASGDSDCLGGQVYWEATAFNIAGAVTTATLGNGLTTYRSYDIAAGTDLHPDQINGVRLD